MKVTNRPVRPRTRAGRLRFLDEWIAHEVDLSKGSALDFGFGGATDTLHEFATALREVQSQLVVIGVEQVFHPPVEFATVVQGGFEALERLSGVGLVRALNVVRGYREEEVPGIHAALARPLVEGGQLVEGSSDTEGHVTVCALFTKTGGALRSDGLLFHTDFSRGFSPWLFRDWLPRALRRRCTPGTAIHALLTSWSDACPPGAEPRERFLGSLHAPGLEATEWERAHGFARAPFIT